MDPVERAAATPLRQLRVIITPYRSGTVSVDLITRRVAGGDHWDRRTGHLSLRIAPDRLEGITASDILRLLADSLEPAAYVDAREVPRPPQGVDQHLDAETLALVL